MSNTFTVTVELGPESKALLNHLLEALTQKNPATHQPSQPASNEPPEIVDEGAEPEESPTYTREDIQALVQTLAGPKTTANPYGGKRTETRAIVKKYADKVSDIPPDKFGEIMGELLKLKEEQ